MPVAVDCSVCKADNLTNVKLTVKVKISPRSHPIWMITQPYSGRHPSIAPFVPAAATGVLLSTASNRPSAAPQLSTNGAFLESGSKEKVISSTYISWRGITSVLCL